MLRDVIRGLLILLLVAVAIIFAVLAWGALSNLWADYRDSSVATYLTVGGLALAVSVGAIATAWFLWRER